jgi:hypothetical protein
MYHDVIYPNLLIRIENMAKIQMDLSKEEDRIVEVYKLVHDLKSKQEAIKQMIGYFEAEIKPKKLNKRDYFQI